MEVLAEPGHSEGFPAVYLHVVGREPTCEVYFRLTRRGTLRKIAGLPPDRHSPEKVQIWSGDGVESRAACGGYRVVWTTGDIPFHLWSWGRRVAEESETLWFGSRWRNERVAIAEIQSVCGTIAPDGTFARVDLRCQSDRTVMVVRRWSIVPLLDVTYGEWDREMEYDWVWRLTQHLAQRLHVSWAIEEGDRRYPES